MGSEEITRPDNEKPEKMDPTTSAVAAAYEITRCTIGRHMGWKPIGEAPKWVVERLAQAQLSVNAGQLPMFFSDPQHDAFFFSVAILASGGAPAPAMCADIVRSVVHLCARFDVCVDGRGSQLVRRTPFMVRMGNFIRNIFRIRKKYPGGY